MKFSLYSKKNRLDEMQEPLFAWVHDIIPH